MAAVTLSICSAAVCKGAGAPFMAAACMSADLSRCLWGPPGPAQLLLLLAQCSEVGVRVRVCVSPLLLLGWLAQLVRVRLLRYQAEQLAEGCCDVTFAAGLAALCYCKACSSTAGGGTTWHR